MPTGLDIQKRFDDLKADLSARALETNTAMTVQIPVRNAGNFIAIYELEANAAGVVTDGGDLDQKIAAWKTAQDAFNTAKNAYENENIAENISALSDAKGEYFNT